MLKLIELYQEHRNLYDTKHNLYYNKHAKFDAFSKISEELKLFIPSISQEDVKMKLLNMRLFTSNLVYIFYIPCNILQNTIQSRKRKRKRKQKKWSWH